MESVVSGSSNLEVQPCHALLVTLDWKLGQNGKQRSCCEVHNYSWPAHHACPSCNSLREIGGFGKQQHSHTICPLSLLKCLSEEWFCSWISHSPIIITYIINTACCHPPPNHIIIPTIIIIIIKIVHESSL